MSIKVMSWVMDDAPVENTTEMVVLYVLADHAHDDGKCAWPSHSTIADKTRCSRRTVIRHIKALEQRGLIYRGDQRHVAHLPADKRPVVWNLNMKMKRQMPDDAGCQNVTSQSGGVTPSAERGDNGGMGGVTPSAERGDTGVTQPVLDPSVDPSLTHPLTPRGDDGASTAKDEPESAPKQKKKTRHEYTPEFEAFWEMWPNHRGQSKFEVSKKFTTALKSADPQTILEGAHRFAADPNLNVDYCPAPTTWLNNRRWEAGPLPSRGGPQSQARSTDPFGGWLPPTQTNAPELPPSEDLFNANFIEHQESY